MALVKMVRDFPEVEGGNTTADIPEEAVALAMDNGWRIAEKPKAEPKVTEKVTEKAEPKEEKVVEKTPRTRKLRDE